MTRGSTIPVQWRLLLFLLLLLVDVVSSFVSPRPTFVSRSPLVILGQQSPSRKRSLRELLDALDRANIAYPPTASRSDLEELLYTNTSSLDASQIKRIQRRRRRQGNQQQQSPRRSTAVARLARNGYDRLCRISDHSYRKARHLGRRLNNWYHTQEDGTRTVPYTYHFKRPSVRIIHDVEVITDTTSIIRPRRLRREARPVTTDQEPSDFLPRITRSEHQDPGEPNHPPLHLLPSKRERLESKRPRPRTTKRPQPKKIYSPYRTGRVPDDDDPYRDTLDRVGDFLATAADQVMWGPLPDEDDYEATSPSSREQGVHRQPTTTSRRGHDKHWKDHLEEQLDTMLGVGEENKFYDRWTKKYAQEGEDGPDNVIVKKKRKMRIPNKPFWEEDASLSELLFGRGQQRNKLFLRRRDGSILSALQLLTEVSCRFGGYICQWASTQNTLPQPVVVFVVASVGLTVSRRRLLSMGIALLVLRTIGELLHGYAEDGWDEQRHDELDDHKTRQSG